MPLLNSQVSLCVTWAVVHFDAIRGNLPQTFKGAIAMTIHKDSAELSAPWRAAAAYLYTLDLDGPALAWEYLRRHVGYQADWLSSQRHAPAFHWGLKSSRRPAARCPPGSPTLGRSG